MSCAFAPPPPHSSQMLRDKRASMADPAWSGGGNLLIEPSAGQNPQSVGRAARDAQGIGGLLVTQTGKKAQFNERRGLRVVFFELCQGLVESQQFLRTVLDWQFQIVQVNPHRVTAA